MTYDYRARKIVALLDEATPIGKAMNALGHISFSAGRYLDESWMGQPRIVDASQHTHVGIAKYPLIVLKSNAAEIKTIIEKAKLEGIFVVDYPQEMFDYGPDDEMVHAIEQNTHEKIEYHAVLLCGDTEKIKTLTGHLKLFK